MSSQPKALNDMKGGGVVLIFWWALLGGHITCSLCDPLISRNVLPMKHPNIACFVRFHLFSLIDFDFGCT